MEQLTPVRREQLVLVFADRLCDVLRRLVMRSQIIEASRNEVPNEEYRRFRSGAAAKTSEINVARLKRSFHALDRQGLKRQGQNCYLAGGSRCRIYRTPSTLLKSAASLVRQLHPSVYVARCQAKPLFGQRVRAECRATRRIRRSH